MNQQLLSQCLSYIDSYWNKIIIKPKTIQLGKKLVEEVLFRPKSYSGHHTIAVPYACIVPNHEKFNYIFYWDTYFMFRGILETKHEWVVPAMVENFFYLFKKYHIIPNFTHPESLGRSQPPFLSSMIFDAYYVLERDKHLTARLRKLFTYPKQWLYDAITIAIEEYLNVWQNDVFYNHYVPKFHLNRYGNSDVGYAQDSEQESGWDMTSRFYNRCNQFLPIDLNCYLYKYETDFAKAAKIFKNTAEQEYWNEAAEIRKDNINMYLWNPEEGFFVDFDYVYQKQSPFLSLAGFVPLWAGIATESQAKLAVKKLPLFETNYGLTITDTHSLAPTNIDLTHIPEPFRITISEDLRPKQWDYPHIWPPLEYLTVIGLLRYGFITEAQRIMNKSITANVKVFEKYGTLLEKLDATTGDMPTSFWYTTQLGFGWTNAVIYRYTKLLDAIKQDKLYDPTEKSYPRLISVVN